MSSEPQHQSPARDLLPIVDAQAAQTSQTNGAEPLRILYCHCSFANVVPKGVKEEVLSGLAESSIPVDFIPDLCEMSARRDPLLAELASRKNVRIAACFPRAVQGLFTAAGHPLAPSGPEVVNMRVLSGAEVLETLSRPEEPKPAFDPETDAEAEVDSEENAALAESSAQGATR